MIAGTDWRPEDPEFVTRASLGLRPGLARPSEIAEIQAECEAERALCLACDDGMVVFDLRPNGASLEMFIWLAVAFKHGAIERQGPAVQAIARDLGATTIAFQTRRRGWSRLLGLDWAPRGSDEFVRQVDGRW